MTVLEVIRRSTHFLATRGVEAPRLQVELMLAHLLQMPRLKLYLDFDRMLDEKQLAALREMVKRRGQREPLQHILGTACFCGYDIEVNSHVLVPRPETERLAELAVEWLKKSPETPPQVLDLATGSGCLAIAIAKQLPTPNITACDVSNEALEVARRNVKRHGLSERIVLCQGDLFGAVPPGACFDLIVTNPPYIPSQTIPGLQPEVRQFDPRLALDGGADGSGVIRRIAAKGQDFLKSGGALMLEFGDDQGTLAKKLFTTPAWQSVRIEKDFSNRERILIAQRSDS